MTLAHSRSLADFAQHPAGRAIGCLQKSLPKQLTEFSTAFVDKSGSHYPRQSDCCNPDACPSTLLGCGLPPHAWQLNKKHTTFATPHGASLAGSLPKVIHRLAHTIRGQRHIGAALSWRCSETNGRAAASAVAWGHQRQGSPSCPAIACSSVCSPITPRLPPVAERAR